jgi:hypothetical protein
MHAGAHPRQFDTVRPIELFHCKRHLSARAYPVCAPSKCGSKDINELFWDGDLLEEGRRDARDERNGSLRQSRQLLQINA